MKRGFRLLRDGVTTFALLAFIGLIALKLQAAREVEMKGPFEVVDGDTLATESGRLRLVGLDAPELRQSCGEGEKVWACGEAARTRLQETLANRQVQCSGRDRDRYGRLLVTCSVDGADPAAELVRHGLAVSTGRYDTEEQAARRDKTGIWSGPFDRPADWRHRDGMMSEVPSWLDAIAFRLGLREATP
ncbi:thermonuclease family protein [Rhizobium sp. LjRoot30]|uniref:thermonuclease family protein n=1 Tax=Rhizobium sp. LjRoot30 TaxID=3342320 RepID=UPI003ECC9661